MFNNSFKIFAPVSIGNFSVGFDLLGLAIKPIDGRQLGDVVEITPATNDQFMIAGKYAQDVPDGDDNLVMSADKMFKQTLKAKGLEIKTHKVTLYKNLPVGSGLGSSAASIVAALKAFNQMYQCCSDLELLEMAGRLEGSISGSIHYDNVAPCLLGGMQLITDYSDKPVSQIPFPAHWYIVIAHPGTSISTKLARTRIPLNISLEDSIKQSQNLAAFIHALYENNFKMAAEFVNDVIAEPHRKSLIPNFDEYKKHSLELGAMAVGISGSGPTVFALCDNLESAHKVQNHALDGFCGNKGFSHTCQSDPTGAKIIE